MIPPDDMYDIAEAKADLIYKLNDFLILHKCKTSVALGALIHTAAIGHIAAGADRESWDIITDAAFEASKNMLESLPDV
jgi:hypothetical protein